MTLNSIFFPALILIRHAHIFRCESSMKYFQGQLCLVITLRQYETVLLFTYTTFIHDFVLKNWIVWRVYSFFFFASQLCWKWKPKHKFERYRKFSEKYVEKFVSQYVGWGIVLTGIFCCLMLKRLIQWYSFYSLNWYLIM